MAKADDGDAAGRSRARTQLINDAQERVHNIRNNWREVSQLGVRGAEGLTLHDFQLAVLEYYDALRPLRDEAAVKDYWADVVLWEEEMDELVYYDEEDRPHRVYKRDGEGYPRVLKRLADVDAWEDDEDASPRRIDKYDLDEMRVEPRTEPVTGFGTLEERADETETVTRTVRNAFGEHEISEQRRALIDGKKLISASHALDEAAAKLGFAPETSVPVEMDPDPI